MSNTFQNKRRYNDQGGRGEGGFNRQKRQRIEYGDEDAVESRTARLGESTNSIENQIDDLAHYLKEEAKEHRDKVIRVILECAAELPEKTSLYATVVGLINCSEYDLVGELVEETPKFLKEYMTKNKWNEARYLVRFAAELVNVHVVSLGSFLNLLERLVDVTVEDGIPQTRSDFFVYAVLSCLPWIGRELQEKKEQDFETLLTSIEEYIGKRRKGHVVSLKVWHTDSPHPQEEYLDCLWAQISKLKSDKWVEHHIIRIYHAFGGTLQEALQHNLPDFSVPPHESSFVYPYPQVVFRLFDYTDCPEGAAVLPGAHSIERFLAEESIRSTIDLMFFNRKDCANALVHLPTIQRYPLEYMIVEVVLGEMLRLPKSIHLEIFYGSLLLELCKLHASSLPLVLAQAVVLMFERIDSMNGGCIDVFSSWFAYHLSNFQFRWTWEDWSSATNLEPLHPKTVFLRETFVRCLRLTYHERVTKLAPEQFNHLKPPPPEPIDKFQGPDISVRLCEIAKEVKAAFKKPRQAGEERNLDCLPDLDNLPPIDGFEGEPAKVNLVVSALLNTSSQSFTHLFTAIGRWSGVLAELMTTDASQVALLKTLFEVWRNHQQLIVITVQKLIKYGVLDCSSVIEWIFSPAMRQELMRSYVWEIVYCTVKRKEAIVREHEEAIIHEKERLKKFQKDRITSDAVDDIPSEDGIEKMEEQLEGLHADVKVLLQLILSRLISVISRHIQDCESQGKSFKNHWFRWAIFRLQQTLFLNHHVVFKALKSFQSVFTSDQDRHIRLIFDQFCALRS